MGTSRKRDYDVASCSAGHASALLHAGVSSSKVAMVAYLSRAGDNRFHQAHEAF
jgi:hypothetical protein